VPIPAEHIRQYAAVVEEQGGATGAPAHRGLSGDHRRWWTGKEWTGPLYERDGLSALVTFLSRFMGTLRVFPGALVFVPAAEGVSRFGNSALNIDKPPVAIVHRAPQVAVVYGRFAVPWLNTGVVLVDPDTLAGGTAVVQMPGWHRRRVVPALDASRLAVDVHRTAFSIGSDIGSQAELDRLRRG